jgi:lipopolysaccharide transport system ATP-binding protein
MSETVIRINNLSKIYKLGTISSGSFVSDITSKIYRRLNYDDPNSKIDDENRENKSEKVALSKINLNVEKGEILGIIGKNGAGKSTLLKILSRITAPTNGKVKIKGRIASLLEIGTGFHPELTGRENIYLNGSIMGMKKKEIDSNIDKIIDFSGIKQYIDTPVKRYSSGMNVRLGFSVAAHLEPEILLVDEVLAVGDIDFQKKCLGKIESISNMGRTIIFVSHNMVAIRSLCSRAILIDNGKIIFDSTPEKTITKYLLSTQDYNVSKVWKINQAPGTDKFKFLSVKISPNQGNVISISSGIKIQFHCYCNLERSAVDISFEILTNDEIKLINDWYLISPPSELKIGEYKVEAVIPAYLLNEGIYKLKVWSGLSGTEQIGLIDKFITFEVSNAFNKTKTLPGLMRPIINFKSKKVFKVKTS